MSRAFNEDLRSVWSIKCTYIPKWKQSYSQKSNINVPGWLWYCDLLLNILYSFCYQLNYKCMHESHSHMQR